MPFGQRHDARIVDEQVQRAGPGVGEGGDGREVERRDPCGLGADAR